MVVSYPCGIAALTHKLALSTLLLKACCYPLATAARHPRPHPTAVAVRECVLQILVRTDNVRYSIFVCITFFSDCITYCLTLFLTAENEQINDLKRHIKCLTAVNDKLTVDHFNQLAKINDLVAINSALRDDNRVLRGKILYSIYDLLCF